MTTPTATFTAQSERVGGARATTLFALSVTHPVAKTWYLAAVPITVGGTVYLPYVLDHGGVSASAALGGSGGPAGITLTLGHSLDTGAPGRSWLDEFAVPVPGYAEPYDLLTATLSVSVVWPDAPTDPLVVGGLLYLQPGAIAWATERDEPATLTLTFGPDLRRYRILPRTRITTARYPHAPDTVRDRPMPVYFGAQRVPVLPLDAEGGLYGICASPTATPEGGVTQLWTIRPDPGATAPRPEAWAVRATTGGEVVFTLAGTTTAVTLTQAAQRFELVGAGAFVYAVRLRLKRASGGTPCVGSLSVQLVLDRDGIPGETLVDPNASATTSASIVLTGSFANYDIVLQANETGRPAFVPGGRACWLVTKYAKTSGDLHIEVDSTGAYAQGILATRATGTDNDWILTGTHTRRGPVSTNFTGVGGLRRVVATGALRALAPVSVAGY